MPGGVPTAARKRRSNTDFAALLRTIKADNDRALALGAQVGGSLGLSEFNVQMLSHALFEARAKNNKRGMEQAAKLFSTVLNSVANARRAEAASRRAAVSQYSARTARKKLRLDMARAALTHSEELGEIRRAEGLTDHEKMLRAAERLFGPASAPEKLFAAASSPGLKA